MMPAAESLKAWMRAFPSHAMFAAILQEPTVTKEGPSMVPMWMADLWPPPGVDPELTPETFPPDYVELGHRVADHLVWQNDPTRERLGPRGLFVGHRTRGQLFVTELIVEQRTTENAWRS